MSRLGVLIKTTQSSPRAEDFTGSSEQPICSYKVQRWELPPTNISVQPRLPRAAQIPGFGAGMGPMEHHSMGNRERLGTELLPTLLRSSFQTSGRKGSHDVNSITHMTEFMSLLPFFSLLTCKRNFLDEKQAQQVHQEPQGCALGAAFSPAASNTTSLCTQVFCLRYFLHSLPCPQSSSSILPSSQDHPKGTSRKTSAPNSSSPDFPRMFVKSLCVIQTLHVTLPTQTGKQGHPPSPTDHCSHWL